MGPTQEQLLAQNSEYRLYCHPDGTLNPLINAPLTPLQKHNSITPVRYCASAAVSFAAQI
jgi:hypothetical protein